MENKTLEQLKQEGYTIIDNGVVDEHGKKVVTVIAKVDNSQLRELYGSKQAEKILTSISANFLGIDSLNNEIKQL